MKPNEREKQLDAAIRVHFAHRPTDAAKPNLTELAASVWLKRKADLEELGAEDRIRFAEKLLQAADCVLDAVINAVPGTNERIDRLFAARYVIKHVVLALEAVDPGAPEVDQWQQRLGDVEAMLEAELNRPASK